METDVLEVLLRHLKHKIALGEEDVAPVFIFCEVLLLAFFEFRQLLGVIALNPARLIERKALVSALCPVFMKESVLNDLELERADGSDDFTSVELVDEELRHALVHKLVDALGELLGLHGVGVVNVSEELGGEAWQPAEVDILAFRDRVSDFEVACVWQADNVAGVGLVDYILLVGHESCGT